MPRVKNISAGRYYHRGTGHLSAGDTADVSEDLAEYLCEECGGFAPVEELEGATVDPDDVVDTLEKATDTLPFNPEEHTVAELEDRIEDVDDAEAVRALRNLEADQESRETALDALDARLDELED